MSPTVPSVDRPGVPYRRRAVNCRYGMCQASHIRISARVMGRSKAHSRSRRGSRRGGRGRNTTMRGGPTCICYCRDTLPDPDPPGDTLAIDLNDGDDFSSGCSGEKICRLGGSRSCVLANVGMRHRRRVGQVQGSSSRSH